MSSEQIFERFQQLLLEKSGITEEQLMEVWNKNSFCHHILSTGGRRGGLCEKKCVKNKLYCKSHLKCDL